MNDKLVIIDGNSLLNRAYYAIRQPMITAEGMYTHGIYAFLNMLNKLIKDYEPDYMAVAFDRKKPTFRHEAYKEYKAGRKKMPLELLMQFQPLKDILNVMNISILEIDGYEADDILGTVSLDAENRGVHTFIVTGDRDSFQLASDKTTVIYTKRGVSDFAAYDENEIINEYGFGPSLFIDYKALMGDPSDNIPGIPGVGDKTARNLVIKYGTVENVIASTDSMKAGKMRNNIEEFAAQAMMSKRLVTIFRSVPLEYEFEELRYTEPDYNALAGLYKKYEFRSFLRKLVSEGKIASGAADSRAASADAAEAVISEKAEIFNSIVFGASAEEIIHISDKNELLEALSVLKGEKYIYLKVFHNDSHIEIPEIMSVCMAGSGNMYIIHWDDAFAVPLSDFFAEYDGGICGHDLKSDYYALLSVNAARIAEKDHIFETLYDSAVAAYLISPEKSSYELSVLLAEMLQEDFPSDKEIKKETSVIDLFGEMYNIQADLGIKILSASNRLMKAQIHLLDSNDLFPVFNDIELPLIEVLADMERNGIGADAGVLNEIGDALKERIGELKDQIHLLAGEDFNINSPQQLGNILFEKLGLKNGKKTKTGYSTSAEILEKIADQHPIVPLILEYRMLAKLTGTYVDGMLPLIDRNGRIHAHFQQTVTATGRLSCTEPNLQNIPVRTELGKQFRKAFVSNEPERRLTGADYSQVELRIMAHISGDEALIESFNENKDIHTITASRVFGIPEDEVTALMRSRAKAVNFGVIYGISGFGLSKDLNITVGEAQEYIDSYYKKHPGVGKFIADSVEFCRENGYVKTIMGRRRFIKEINASNRNLRMFGERLAMNSPVQGSAADIIKIAMINIYRRLNAEFSEAKLVLQVHDELIIDSFADDSEKISKLLEECMSNAVSLKVPLTVDVSTGSSWFELK